MNPCPNCQEPVLEMAEKCRHCGEELDEATFFLNEGEMVAEIMAMQKEAAEKEAKILALGKKVKLNGALAAVAILCGIGLVAFATFYLKGLGALIGVAGAGFAIMALKAKQQLKALDS